MTIEKHAQIIMRRGRYYLDHTNIGVALQAVKERFPRADLDRLRQHIPMGQLITRNRMAKLLSKGLQAQNLDPDPDSLQIILRSMK